MLPQYVKLSVRRFNVTVTIPGQSRMHAYLAHLHWRTSCYSVVGFPKLRMGRGLTPAKQFDTDPRSVLAYITAHLQR